MKRLDYYNYIEEKLNFLSFRVEQRGKLNLLDLNIYSESFFADLLNLVFSYQFINLNTVKQNVEGIDLIDEQNKIIAQVTSTNTKAKLKKSLSKNIIKKYKDYSFKFILIAKSAKSLQKSTFENPHNIAFNPCEDIIDVTYILTQILSLNADRQKEIYDFIKKELGNELDIVKTDTNLSVIINILAKEPLQENIAYKQIKAFEIEKKIEFNKLEPVQEVIDDYKIYYQKLNEKYNELDKISPNQSFSILQSIRHNYVEISTKNDDPVDVFYKVIERLIETIKGSANYEEIAFEYLEICTYIIVVDAFMKCKIFKNPKG